MLDLFSSISTSKLARFNQIKLNSVCNRRKKLLLALQAMNIGGGNAFVDEPSGRLDYNWVMRWLDDLGLPQYKASHVIHHFIYNLELKVFNFIIEDAQMASILFLIKSFLQHCSHFHRNSHCRITFMTPGLMEGCSTT